MFYALITVLVASVIIVVVIKQTKLTDYRKKTSDIKDERLNEADAAKMVVDGELTVKAGYLHYDMTEAYDEEKTDEPVTAPFVGYVNPDAQHDGTILVFDDDGVLKGIVKSQHQLYEQLLTRRHTNCYGIITADSQRVVGEVCIRNIIP